ncbi:MAG: hypothetical protein MUO72_06215 [Bacteroidales bacterium]|nr:hypothetical protein [Bacteroidales bacterium]
MKPSEIKKLIIGSMDVDAAPEEIARKLEEEGVSYDFSKGFSDRVIDKIFKAGVTIVRQTEFVRNLNSAFYRVALTGVAAIVVLLISIFLMEGSISFNSFLGLGDSYDESIVCLLTGN